MRAVRDSSARGLQGLRLVALIVPTLLMSAFLALDYFVIEPSFDRTTGHLALLAIGIAGVIAFSVSIFERLEAVARQRERQSATLAALNSAGMSLSAELVSGQVLKKIVDLARVLAQARYAALGVFDDSGQLAQFPTSGLSEEERLRIGDPPHGLGILGLLQHDARPLRLRDLKQHPSFIPFPANHPEMHSFLGVPIRLRGHSIGNLYLAEKIGADEFTEDDERALLTLAAQAAIAIENARLYEQTRRVSVLEERHRIGMDLHDGVMQSLYGIGLLIENAGIDLSAAPQRARQDLGRAVDRLNASISDLRSYVLGLRPIPAGERPLAELLPALAEQIAANALLSYRVDVAPDLEPLLGRSQREAMFYVASDALGNVARHARASRIGIALKRSGQSAVLEIEDDGVGFVSTQATEGFGLRNMKERAFAAGGQLQVKAAPGRGTRIRLALPIEEVSQ